MADDGAWEFVQRINRAWCRGAADEMNDLFHTDAVIVHPDFEGRTVGRDAVVDSYRELAAHAAVSRLDELSPSVNLFGDLAIVTYRFKIHYAMDGEAFTDAGQEIYVLRRPADHPPADESGSGWQAVWRAMVMVDEVRHLPPVGSA